MANSKKFFINIDLQGNELQNPTIGANADMTKAGSFQYNASQYRLEYFDNTEVQRVANLNDVNALSSTQNIFVADWTYDNVNEYYYKEITHSLLCFNPTRSACSTEDGSVYELAYETVDVNTIKVMSNTAIDVNVAFVKSNGNA